MWPDPVQPMGSTSLRLKTIAPPIVKTYLLALREAPLHEPTIVDFKPLDRALTFAAFHLIESGLAPVHVKRLLFSGQDLKGFPCLKLPLFSASLFSAYILRVSRSFHLYPAFQSLLTACAVRISQVRYWRRSNTHSDPTCMTVAWPNGGGYGVFPAVEVDTEVPWVQPV